MKLYINTKDMKQVTVEIRDKGKVIREETEKNEYGSQVLLPLIEKIIKQEGLEFKDLSEIEVNTGPGSFTGLRVGAAVAQALGYALNIPVNGKINKPVKLKYT